MRIATWNVNSIRKRLPLVLDWLANQRPDVLCLQETKVRDADFPAEAIRAAGYHVVFCGASAYNGVATLSLTEPERILNGFGDGDEDRLLLTTIAGLPIVNTYVPQGYKVGTEKYTYKLAWFARLRRFFDVHLDPAKPAVWLGDVNVAPEPIDVYHPDRRVGDVDFHIDARNAYKDVVAWGWTDTFRRLHLDRVEYTYWDYFRNAYGNNWGWRIDHILATAPLAARCRRVEVDRGPREAAGSSDHTVVFADFD